jgi:hypothetical protein
VSSEVSRLSPVSRAWRLGATGAVLGGLLLASAYGTNDDFPLGPMTQFAFYIPSNGGTINAQWLEADTAGGRHVMVPTDAGDSGLKRAEVEGQISRLVHDPALLQGIADAQRRLHPGASPYTRIYLVKQIKTLRDGRVRSTRMLTLATWTVR